MTEKITSKILGVGAGGNFFSLEFFPPKTSMGEQNLYARLERMTTGLRPLFVTVTWGAGGSTATKSLELAGFCQTLGLTTCLHLTCTNMSTAVLTNALEAAKEMGIRNILALRGDPPRHSEYQTTPPPEGPTGEQQQEGGEEFHYAVDLVRFIRRKYGDYFCIGVAAYPEGHGEGSYPEFQDPKRDLPYLIEKVKAGADFIITQLFYDVTAYESFEDLLRGHESGTFKDIPIIPGLMPVHSYQILKKITKLSHAKLPPTLAERFENIRNDDEAVKAAGVDVLSDIIERVKTKPSPTPRGFHFYTLNLEKSVAFIVERCKLTQDILYSDEDVAVADEEIETGMSNGLPVRIQPQRRDSSTRRRSSVASDPYDRVIVDTLPTINQDDVLASATEASVPLILSQPSRENNIAISEGEGSLGREATWDDFPNGRWGDARSPAYGEIDGYGVSLHMSPQQAIKLWGEPSTRSEISELFVKNIKGELQALPWSEDGMTAESSVIEEQLVNMNRKGWWTVASQPAVNSARSDHRTFGWGPKGGYVFQKSFVEFFLPDAEWSALRRKLEGNESVTYYSGNKAGDYISNMSATPDAMNAVTWGVFPGKEIATPTIIEELSFKSWRDEAFAIWTEWQRIYPPQSSTAQLLRRIKDDYWLVTLIHHDYVDDGLLWKEVLEV